MLSVAVVRVAASRPPPCEQPAGAAQSAVIGCELPGAEAGVPQSPRALVPVSFLTILPGSSLSSSSISAFSTVWKVNRDLLRSSVRARTTGSTALVSAHPRERKHSGERIYFRVTVPSSCREPIREYEAFDFGNVEGAPSVWAGLCRVATRLIADEALFARSRDSVRVRFHSSNAPAGMTETDDSARSNGLADTRMQTDSHCCPSAQGSGIRQRMRYLLNT